MQQFYSTTELARKACVTRKTIWTWCVYGCPIRGVTYKLEAERWGRQFRISEEQWERFHAAINGKPVEAPKPDMERLRRDEAARERLRAYGVKC